MTEVTPPASDSHRALKAPAISFEFFPPKTEEMERNLWEAISRLAPLAPNFVSVTYGAGGSARERPHSPTHPTPPEPPLLRAAPPPGADPPCSAVEDGGTPYHEGGARHIVALRGDPVGG